MNAHPEDPLSREAELQVLTDGLERLLKLQFPNHDGWNTGLIPWERDRRKAIDILLAEIAKPPT